MKTKWNKLKNETTDLILLFCLTLPLLNCTKTPPALIYQPIPSQYQKLTQPEKLYPEKFKGPFECKIEKFKCISNVDLKTELDIKAKMIEAIKYFNETLTDQNNQYLEYYAKPCGIFDFSCKKERQRKKTMVR